MKNVFYKKNPRKQYKQYSSFIRDDNLFTFCDVQLFINMTGFEKIVITVHNKVLYTTNLYIEFTPNAATFAAYFGHHLLSSSLTTYQRSRGDLIQFHIETLS